MNTRHHGRGAWIILFLIVGVAFSLYAESPELINYQGRLADGAGHPVDGTTVDLTFSFYGVESGSTPHYLTVVQEDVLVIGGLYNVLIGSGTVVSGEENALGAVFQNHPEVWMGVKVDADAEMTPRSRIGSVPYALSAPAPSMQGAVYRWNTFNTYSDGSGWMMDNNLSLFGGVTPSQWTDGGYRASQISADKEVQRALFTRKGYAGKNANIYSGVYHQYSSTDGQVVAVLFRVKNSTNGVIAWHPYFYYSCYNSWNEKASVAINGTDVWYTLSNCGTNCTASVTINVPANRASTIIFVSTTGAPYNPGNNVQIRPIQLGFYNDSLALPAGLEFVDDLDTATGGWEQ